MVFLYQDSIESVVGARANCVGRQIGEDNANFPGIMELLELFGPDFKFRFPFRKAAGTDEVTNSYVLNFWAPPEIQGKKLPVKYWRTSQRSRWRWAFPEGTVFGEVLFEQSPQGQWYPFEVRTRKRYLDGWDVDVFRPYTSALELTAAIKEKRPNWMSQQSLAKVVEHLSNPQALVSARLESKPFKKGFEPVSGYLDQIPDLQDAALTAELLSVTTFQSTQGKIWKGQGNVVTYAPGSLAEFSLVPKNYQMGLIPVNEVSCNRCHSQTGRRLADFQREVPLYGEVWGEDQIFTWHLFEPHERIWGPWDDTDKSRVVNSRLVTAQLVVNEKPKPGDVKYKPLPTLYVPERIHSYENNDRQEIRN